MEKNILHEVAQYAEEVLGSESFRYTCAVVANCKMLALELEMQANEGEPVPDLAALTIAAYLHDISTVTHGFHDHQYTSAEMAATYLRARHVPEQCIELVKQAILTHTIVATSDEERARLPIEGRILYDADKLGRLSGLAVITSLIEFGMRHPNRVVTGDALAALLRHIEERFIDLYQSLNTAPAREMARDKFDRTLAFLDGVIEHLSDATPV